MRLLPILAAVALLLMRTVCHATSVPVMRVGPPATLEIIGESRAEHDIYISREPETETYHHGALNISLSLISLGNKFQVEVANVQLPDGRILFKIRAVPDYEPDCHIYIIDRGDSPGRVIFSGKLSDIPRRKSVRPQ